MVHLLVIMLGIAAFHWSDLISSSIFFSVILPLVFVASVMYAMTLAIYLMQGKSLGREQQEDTDRRFLAHINKGVGEDGRKKR